ncbi:MAG: DUF3050 domain-containing protein [Planctomycetes bacterium]|nr:DUF3050 domain-containing protein [Planctomycetota bacterium]
MHSRKLEEEIQALRERLATHEAMHATKDLVRARCFLGRCSFLAWDFMALVGSMRERFTRTRLPWVPVGIPELRRLVHQVSIVEESDLALGEGASSHFETFLKIAKELDSDTDLLEEVIRRIRLGEPYPHFLTNLDCPSYIHRFLESTWHLVTRGSHEEVLGVFTFSREHVIGDFWSKGMEDLSWAGEAGERLRAYGERHIELSMNDHEPFARDALERLCGEDSGRWARVSDAVHQALRVRLNFFDGLAEELAVLDELQESA